MMDQMMTGKCKPHCNLQINPAQQESHRNCALNSAKITSSICYLMFSGEGAGEERRGEQEGDRARPRGTGGTGWVRI